jgi:hypothetical protein
MINADNFIRIDNVDVSIYRIFPIDRFCELLKTGNAVLVRPELWDDPFENILSCCGICDTSKTPFEGHLFGNMRRPLYAQCWSMIKESDTLLRAYAIVKKDETGRNRFRELEGVQVNSTARKLLEALWKSIPINQAEICFLGKVKYQPESELLQYFRNEIVSRRLQAFDEGLSYAGSVLRKRDFFSHEQEVRLIHIGNGSMSSKTFCIPVNPNDLFDEVTIDPRLAIGERLERREEIIKLGYSGLIETDAKFYQKIFWNIPLDLSKK